MTIEEINSLLPSGSQAYIEGDKLFITKRFMIKEHRIMHDITNTSVVCEHCGSIYDLSKVEPDHRLRDCDDFTSPCCKRSGCDTRPYSQTDFVMLWEYLNDFE